MVAVAKDLASRSPSEIFLYFCDHPDIARLLLHESYDKRCTPSTFIEETGSGFKVGWLSRKLERECEREFSTLADAATDYLWFSLGKGRWRPPEDATEV